MDIYINKDGQQYGPYTLDQVNEYLAQGSLQTTDPAWHDGLAEWCPLSQIAGVVDPSSPTPPSFDPTTYRPDVAVPPAVAFPSPTDAVQAEGPADSGQILVSTNSPERLPAPIMAKISGYIMMAVSIGILFLSLWFGVTFYKKYKAWEPPSYDVMAENRFGLAENGVMYVCGLVAFLGGLGLGYKSLQQILGARICSECKRYITKYDATCPGCKAMFERPT